MNKSLIDSISVVGSIVTIATAIPLVMSSSQYKYIYLSLYIFIVSLLILSTILLKYKSATYRFIIYFFKKNSDHILLLKETKYEFLSRTSMIHEKKYILKSKSNSFHELTTRFGWSKDEELVPVPLNSSHQIVKTWKSDKMTNFTILFDRHYGINEVVETGFKLNNLQDPDKESLLYLSTGIFEKTKCVRLVLKFEKKLIPKNIELKVFRKYFDHGPQLTKRLEYNFENKEIAVEDLYPLFLSKYIITWEFED